MSDSLQPHGHRKSGQVPGLQEHPSSAFSLGGHSAFTARSTCASSPGRMQGSSVSAGPLVYAAHSSFLLLGWARTGRLGSWPCSFPFCSWTLVAPWGLHSGELHSSLWAHPPSVGFGTLFKKRVEGTSGCRVRRGCPDLASEAQECWKGGSGGTQGPALLFLHGTVPCW